MNCLAQMHSTKSTMNDDGVPWGEADGGRLKRATSSLMYIGDAS